MKLLDLTFPTPEENLACDEALLEQAESGTGGEVLRFWEASSHFVVLGYSNKAEAEVNVDICRKNLVSIFRRPSGGGTVLQGPGCLNYSLILKIPESGPLSQLTGTNQVILQNHCEALMPLLGDSLKIQGISDLALGNKKFSGNAQRRKKNFLLFHGTFLYRFDINLIEKYLKLPTREPSYRQNRSHTDFITNIPLSPAPIKQALQKTWDAVEPIESIPGKIIFELMEKHYSKRDWNFKF